MGVSRSGYLARQAAWAAQGQMEEGLPATRPLAVGTELTVHHLSLLERNRYYRAFISGLPFGTAAAIVFWSAMLNRKRAISIAMTCAPHKLIKSKLF